MDNKKSVLIISEDNYLYLALQDLLLGGGISTYIVNDSTPIAHELLARPYRLVLIDKRIRSASHFIVKMRESENMKNIGLLLISFGNSKKYIKQNRELFGVLNVSSSLNNIYHDVMSFIENVEFCGRVGCWYSSSKDCLTRKQVETIKLFANGISPMEISLLHKSKVKTVYSTKYSALQKMGFRNFIEFILFRKLIGYELKDDHFS